MVNVKYGAAHKRLRANLSQRSVGQPCARCGRLIRDGEPLELDHRDDGAGYLGMSHTNCNRVAGGRKGGLLKAERRRMPMDDVALGIDIARDRSRTAAVIAGWAEHPQDGKVIACYLKLFRGAQPTAEILELVAAHSPKAVAVNGAGYMRTLTEPLKANRVRVEEATGQDMVDATSRLVDALNQRLVRIPEPHPELTAAVQHARVRQLVDGETVDKRQAERDLSPLVALELAVWGVVKFAKKRPPRIYSLGN